MAFLNLKHNMAKKASYKLPTLDAIRKRYPQSEKASIVVPDDPEKVLWLPCESLAINRFLGGGIPYGKILEILGYESTGKSLLALNFGKVAQKLGGVLLWADAESSWSNHWARQNGVDPTKVEIYDDNAVEPMSDWIRDMIIYYRSILVNNEPILVVCDSIAALECKENIESDQDDGKAEMGNRAKAIYKMYRKRNSIIAKYGAIMIAINQVREKVGAGVFESAESTPGGAATKFYASQRLALIRSKQIKLKIGGKEKKVGQNIILQSRKNKVAPPQDSVYTEVYFRPEKWDYVGYSKYAGLPDILLEEGIVKKKGSRYYRKEKNICNGEEAFVKLLHEDDDLRAKLIKKSSINTISKTRAKLEKMDTNLYPVKLKTASEDE